MVDESTGQIDLSSFYLRQGARLKGNVPPSLTTRKKRDVSDIRSTNCHKSSQSFVRVQQSINGRSMICHKIMANL